MKIKFMKKHENAIGFLFSSKFHLFNINFFLLQNINKLNVECFANYILSA